MLTGLNHITVAVKDLERSLEFYVSNLGMKPKAKWENGAYLTTGDLWFCLSVGKSYPSNDYSHIAFSIEESDFKRFSLSIQHASIPVWKENISEGNSIYILDPDGHKLEIHTGGLESRLRQLRAEPYENLEWC